MKERIWIAVCLLLTLRCAQVDAQNHEKAIITQGLATIALPEKTLLPPFSFAPIAIRSINVVKGKPFRDFPGTVYFNPGEAIAGQNTTGRDIQVIGALRCYLDTSFRMIAATDSFFIENGLPLKLANGDIPSFFQPFYFKRGEVTNREYREFTTWVRDSIARTLLAQIYPDRYYLRHSKTLNWETPIDWGGQDKNGAEALKALLQDEEDLLFRQKSIDVNKLIYTYADRDNHVKNIAVYPDTLVWIRDFPYSFNEFQFRHFNFKAYDDYPVTGINYYQAKAYCHWKAQQIQKTVQQEAGFKVEVDLPFDYEREYVMTHYAKEGDVDMGCLTDLMAIRSPAFYPSLLDEILDCDNALQSRDELKIFGTHPADLSRISPRKRALVSNDMDEHRISGLRDNVSEWMNESYALNWQPFITMRQQLLEAIKNEDLAVSISESFSGVMSTDSLYSERLRFLYKEEITFMLKLEELFNRYCDADGRLVRGGNWKDNGSFIQCQSRCAQKKAGSKDALTFVSPAKSSSMIGFRYVIRVRPIE